MRFRTNLERIGRIFAYEISKTLDYKKIDIETPLGIASIMVPDEQLVLGTILRAGLPLHNGILSVFDKAENSFVSAYRKYGKDNKFTIQIEYASSPSVQGKTLILADTMSAYRLFTRNSGTLNFGIVIIRLPLSFSSRKSGTTCCASSE